MDFRRIRAEHQQSALGEERLQRILPLGRSVNYLTQYTTDSSHWSLRPKRLQHDEGGLPRFCYAPPTNHLPLAFAR
jgi:hypothetical protein